MSSTVHEPQDTRILVIEDNVLDRKLLQIHLDSHGYAARFVHDGAEGWAILEDDPEAFDIVILDRSMPTLNGLEVLGRMKRHQRLRMVPVIMQTAHAAREEILEGMRAGAYYYLTKPYDPEVLIEVVRTAASDYAEYRRLQDTIRRGVQSLRLMNEAVMELRTVSEARDIASILASTCPDPQSIVIGLTELLLNAVEHGNAGITYDEKSQFDTRMVWEAEVARRLALPENANKRVYVRFERDRDEIRFLIRDEGPGFDWTKFLDIDPARAFDTHGRGIAMARHLSFSSIEYRGTGSEVIARVKC